MRDIEKLAEKGRKTISLANELTANECDLIARQISKGKYEVIFQLFNFGFMVGYEQGKEGCKV